MISSITNIQTYVIGYTSQQVELEMDITTNRYFLSKILGNNLYLNDFDKFIYIVSASTYYLNSNVGFYQNNEIFVIDNQVEYNDYIFKNDKLIYIFKDIKNYVTLSEFNSTSYTIQTNDDLSDVDIEVLEVKFNGKPIKNYNLNKTTKSLTINDTIYYNYVNEIVVTVGNRNIDSSKIRIYADYLHHTKIRDGYDYIKENYLELTESIQDISINRGLFDSFKRYRRLDDIAIHNEPKSIRNELSIKFKKDLMKTPNGYDEGLYDEGTYGATLNSVESLVTYRRFRIILYDNIIQDILVFNNCKTREDFNYELSTINTLNMVIDTNKEIRVPYLFEKEDESGCN